MEDSIEECGMPNLGITDEIVTATYVAVMRSDRGSPGAGGVGLGHMSTPDNESTPHVSLDAACVHWR